MLKMFILKLPGISKDGAINYALGKNKYTIFLEKNTIIIEEINAFGKKKLGKITSENLECFLFQTFIVFKVSHFSQFNTVNQINFEGFYLSRNKIIIKNSEKLFDNLIFIKDKNNKTLITLQSENRLLNSSGKFRTKHKTIPVLPSSEVTPNQTNTAASEEISNTLIEKRRKIEREIAKKMIELDEQTNEMVSEGKSLPSSDGTRNEMTSFPIQSRQSVTQGALGALFKQKEEADKKILALEASLRTLGAEKNYISSKLTQLQEEVNKCLDKQITDAERAILLTQNTNLKAENNLLLEQNANLQSENSFLTNQKNELENEINSLENSISRYTTNIEFLNSEIDSLLSFNDSLENKNTELQSNYDFLLEEKNQVDKSNKELIEKYNNFVETTKLQEAEKNRLIANNAHLIHIDEDFIYHSGGGLSPPDYLPFSDSYLVHNTSFLSQKYQEVFLLVGSGNHFTIRHIDSKSNPLIFHLLADTDSFMSHFPELFNDRRKNVRKMRIPVLLNPKVIVDETANHPALANIILQIRASYNLVNRNEIEQQNVTQPV